MELIYRLSLGKNIKAYQAVILCNKLPACILFSGVFFKFAKCLTNESNIIAFFYFL